MSAEVSPLAKTGPLAGLTVIEMAGIGPVPLAGLMLSEMGAEVLRIERAGSTQPFLSLPDEYDIDRHGRSMLRIDLKRQEGVELVLRLAEKADMLIEGFRPDVMERLGLGPDAAVARNPALIYGRMTGFGQNGPLSGRAGHDITYLAYSGVLHAIGQEGSRPVPPLNLVADYGGGAMMLIAGALAALFERSRSGKGQVIDAAMTEGASMLTTPMHALMAAGLWSDRRGANLLDSGAPFYDTYETADARHVAVGCLEPRFFAEFARLLPLDERFVRGQYDRTLWPEMRAAIVDRVRQKTRDDWDRLFAATDACFAPVLSLREARDHPHNRARNAFVTSGALERPAPAPRFSRSRPTLAAVPAVHDRQAATVLARFGLSASETEALVKSGVIG
ncbi:CoA transferase [Mesorhizobium mediterraneum]|uniref:Carnitine dehydratase n=1 Tax=Mesorhizobium mediterraneum TaxID=43617 RepID=A0AB36RE32_9HYPH|nr:MULTISPECIES: CaiB/BaiF CoA-transferase family protein [Mesorhizobium]RUU32643.1 CoA transferase [Mesorhizobium sp. M6A.T.Ca.TU.002.02.2.1]PAQ02704.1 carnitine dehydratase [Mesorhizobium mediterraneum]RUU27740.1 CoA transferase [Mesorhizobium sp. M6A.T.Ce.TU.016.01.1.1]RUU96753.1 CoA transferase [Mesorhizobium sp. M6A.T.Cr.TU.017.01.1.1]RVB78272.1 CoA transferase [Mesorhizobium sp. M6A.T.Cr.TU.014.01.1.1]